MIRRAELLPLALGRTERNAPDAVDSWQHDRAEADELPEAAVWLVANTACELAEGRVALGGLDAAAGTVGATARGRARGAAYRPELRALRPGGAVREAELAELVAGGRRDGPRHEAQAGRREVVAHVERFGVRLHAWIVNDREVMERLLDLGVHGIMTDNPALLADVLAHR